MRRSSLMLVAILEVLSCTGCHADTPDNAQVLFKTDAPFCSPLLIEKVIDGVVAARDTMRNGQASAAVIVAPGRHVLGARVISFSVQIPFNDTTVTLAANESFTRVLPFYCS